MGLYDKLLFEPKTRGHVVDLGDCLASMLCSPGVTTFRLRGQKPHEAGVGCQNLCRFTSDYLQCNPHSNVAECGPRRDDKDAYAGEGKKILGTA